MPTRDEKDNPALELLKGTLDVLVLKALSAGPQHGFGIARWIKRSTDRVLLVEDAPLYKALHRLERDGFVEGEWGVTDNNRRARFYSLTAAGRRHLRAEAAQFRTYANAVFRALDLR